MQAHRFDPSSMFEALSHPTRIRILRLIHERPRSFAELKHELGLESSGHLQHHMSKLSGLVTDHGQYVITTSGLAALKILEDSERPGSSLESICSTSDRQGENDQIRSELDHVHIKFSNRNQTLDFYQALGFKVQRERVGNGEYVFIALSRGQIAPSEESSKDKISIGVLVNDLDRVYRLARNHGVNIVDDIKERSWGPRVFTARDPNGYLIEFQQAVTT